MVTKLLCTDVLKSTNKITLLVQSFVSVIPHMIGNGSFIVYRCCPSIFTEHFMATRINIDVVLRLKEVLINYF